LPAISAFDREGPTAYDAWFDGNPHIYQAELQAVRSLRPAGRKGLDIGVGTGRFAVPLGIGIGVEPSPAMAAKARARGIAVIGGLAEALPLADRAFDFAVMITVVCFLNDPAQAFREAKRILRPRGALIVGFIDRESDLGRSYQQRKGKSRFYRDATFYSAADLRSLLLGAGYSDLVFRQTLLPGPADFLKVAEGHGRGGFTVVRAVNR
jgi:SAM-dependent methyltransferase